MPTRFGGRPTELRSWVRYYQRMPRTARATVGGVCYHVMNRGNRRARVYHEPEEYEAFVWLIRQACERLPMRILAYCLMPNHFHLCVWPHADDDLSRWMHWLMTCHVTQYHRLHGTSGRIWQGRFTSFPIQQDEHLLTVLRYVERNPLRANLVHRAEDWRWSSLPEWLSQRQSGFLCNGPVTRPDDWLSLVDKAHGSEELAALRNSATREAPFGSAPWTLDMVERLGLESSVRRRGRPARAVSIHGRVRPSRHQTVT